MCGEETRRINLRRRSGKPPTLMVWRFLFGHEFLMQPKGEIMYSPDKPEEQQRQIKINADIESLRRQRQFSWYEKLDHFHFGSLFSGDDACFVRERFCTRRDGNNTRNGSDERDAP